MKKILIALDYEPSAKVIADEEWRIAKALKAKVTLYVIRSPAEKFFRRCDVPLLINSITSV
ncbi:MAG TPA: hypothetical protein VNT20_09880 [Flavisolibacter sp.]|jgi:hypothetical protein|nr:hypothetical protein [Flavisolibacter sp.]